jgi:hypothetical protein
MVMIKPGKFAEAWHGQKRSLIILVVKKHFSQARFFVRNLSFRKKYIGMLIMRVYQTLNNNGKNFRRMKNICPC